MSAYNRQGRPSEDGNPIDWDAAGDADAIRAKFEALPPEVQQKILSWRPRNIDSADAAAVEIVLPAVRSCVAAVQPDTPKTVVSLLSPTLHMALWWHERCGNVDAVAMLTPPNVERFATVVDAARTPTPAGRHSVRSKLRRVAPGSQPEPVAASRGRHEPRRT